MSNVKKILALIVDLVEQELIQIALALLTRMNDECKKNFIQKMEPKDRQFFAQNCTQ